MPWFTCPDSRALVHVLWFTCSAPIPLTVCCVVFSLVVFSKQQVYVQYNWLTRGALDGIPKDILQCYAKYKEIARQDSLNPWTLGPNTLDTHCFRFFDSAFKVFHNPTAWPPKTLDTRFRTYCFRFSTGHSISVIIRSTAATTRLVQNSPGKSLLLRPRKIDNLIGINISLLLARPAFKTFVLGLCAVFDPVFDPFLCAQARRRTPKGD